jgi:hypothetical protein
MTNLKWTWDKLEIFSRRDLQLQRGKCNDLGFNIYVPKYKCIYICKTTKTKKTIWLASHKNKSIQLQGLTCYFNNMLGIIIPHWKHLFKNIFISWMEYILKYSSKFMFMLTCLHNNILATQGRISPPWQFIRIVKIDNALHDLNNMTRNPYGWKQDIMSQWCYFRRGLHVLLPKNIFFIQMNFWMKYFSNCYKKCL